MNDADFTNFLSSLKLLMLKIKDWMAIVKADFDFHFDNCPPVLAKTFLFRPNDGTYVLRVMSRVNSLIKCSVTNFSY